MDVGKIIVRGFQLYKQNWKPMLLLGFLVTLFVMTLQITLFPVKKQTSDVVYIMVNFIFSPIFASGCYLYFIRLWRNESPHLSVLLHYCSSFKKYGRVLIFYLWYYLYFLLFLLLALFLPGMILFIILGVFLDWGAIILTLLLLGGVYCWFILRMFLCEYLFLFREEAPSQEILLEGFQSMKENVGSLFLLMLFQMILSLLYIVPEIVLLQFSSNFSLWTIGAFLIFSFLMQVLLTPFLGVTEAGFASDLLQQQEWRRQSSSPEYLEDLRLIDKLGTEEK